ncbi:MAG: periplasmic component of an type molybdate transport system-like protein [Rhizobacter sp.]|nr:periplasmic component of an type molybdate transport system-like protein [Rhizobacter sp.]
MTIPLTILCAGAAQGLATTLATPFEQQADARLTLRFGPIGALKEWLLAGDPCDVLIASDAMVAALQGTGELSAHPRSTLGRVPTGVAVRSHEPMPNIGTADELRQSLLRARAVYFPDPKRATSGMHMADVLERLGIEATLRPLLRHASSGTTTMQQLAADGAPGAIGMTQVTEINDTPGVELVGTLPDELGLSTLYSAAIGGRSAHPGMAQRFIELLAGPESRTMRKDSGFEFD